MSAPELAEAIGHAIEHQVMDDVSRSEIAALAASAALVSLRASQPVQVEVTDEALKARVYEHEMSRVEAWGETRPQVQVEVIEAYRAGWSAALGGGE